MDDWKTFNIVPITKTFRRRIPKETFLYYLQNLLASLGVGVQHSFAATSTPPPPKVRSVICFGNFFLVWVTLYVCACVWFCVCSTFTPLCVVAFVVTREQKESSIKGLWPTQRATSEPDWCLWVSVTSQFFNKLRLQLWNFLDSFWFFCIKDANTKMVSFRARVYSVRTWLVV